MGREYRRKGCGISLGIFNFLIFLVYLLALIQDVMIDVVTNIMIDGQSVQASITYMLENTCARLREPHACARV